MALLAALWLLIAQTTPPPMASESPSVSVWYRGDPAGTPRQDDLAVIRALGFPRVTWPAQHAAGLADLLVVVPPLLWGSEAGLLAVVHDEPATRRVPVLILAPVDENNPFPRVPRLFMREHPGGSSPLYPLIDRACEWSRTIGHANGTNGVTVPNGSTRAAAPAGA